MGSDCSNCGFSKVDDKSVEFENMEKINNSKTQKRKEKVEFLNSKPKLKIKDFLDQNPAYIPKLIKIQSLIRRYRHSQTYKSILKKFRVKIF